MYPDLQGKTAVVTGSSKGLGAAIAKRFAKEGLSVVINCLTDLWGGQKVVKEIEEKGGKAICVQADVRTEKGVRSLKDSALTTFNRLDIWVNNAGVEKQIPTHEMTMDEWMNVINVDLNGVFLGSREALNHFLSWGVKGCIINMSSVHEIIPWPTFANYAASKAGVGMFTRSIAMEYASRGIRVNAIGPGAINTPINAEKFEDPQALEDTVEMIPMKKIGDPKDVAAVAAWLASDEARYVTGITLFVDGGMTLYPSFQEGKG